MTFVLRQTAKVSSVTAAQTATFPSATLGTKSLLVAFVQHQSNATVPSFADNLGGSVANGAWVRHVSASTADLATPATSQRLTTVFYRLTNPGGITTLTSTMATSNGHAIIAKEFTFDAATVAVRDIGRVNTGTDPKQFLITAAVGDLIFSNAAYSGSAAPGATGYTLDTVSVSTTWMATAHLLSNPTAGATGPTYTGTGTTGIITTGFYEVPSNLSPVANAGTNQTGVEPGSTVTVGGTDSDPDGTVVSVAWTQIGGPTVTLSSTTAASPTFTAPIALGPSTVVLRKTVTDNGGATATADVSVGVLSAARVVKVSGSMLPVVVQVVTP